MELWESAYRTLASYWEIASDQEPIETVVIKVHKELSGSGTGKRSLLIFDNAEPNFRGDKLKGQLPSHTDILFTSKVPNWPISLLNLDSDESSQLTVEEGIKILKGWIKGARFDLEEAEKIVRRFYGLPVAIAQAGKYLSSPVIPMKEYLPLFDRNKKKILQEGAIDSSQGSKRIDIAVSIKMVLEQIKSTAPEALDFLYCCSCLPSKKIPQGLLLKLCNKSFPTLHHYSEQLTSLITFDHKGATIHELFQDLIIEEMGAEKERILSKVAQSIEEDSSAFLLTNPCKAIFIYEQGIKDEQQKSPLDSRRVASFYLSLGDCYSQVGDLKNSLKSRQSALQMFKDIHKEEHLDVAKSLNDVGESLYVLGRYQEALISHRAALEIRKKLLGEKHPDLATSLNNVGASLGNLGRLEEALTSQEAALGMYKKLLGEKHPYVALSLNNVGSCLRDLGRHEEALASQLAALKMHKKLLGKEHLYVAVSLNNVGVTLSHLGRHEEALASNKEAFIMACRIYQKAHPDLIRYLEDIVDVLNQLDDQVLIETTKKELYPLCLRIYKDNHPQIQKLMSAGKK